MTTEQRGLPGYETTQRFRTFSIMVDAMMAVIKDQGRRVLEIPLAWLAAIIVPGLGAAGWALTLLISLNTAWTKNEVRLVALEEGVRTLASEQVAGRSRGDNRQLQINTHETKIAVIAATLSDLKEGVAESNAMLRRLMEQRFGANAPPN